MVYNNKLKLTNHRISLLKRIDLPIIYLILICSGILWSVYDHDVDGIIIFSAGAMFCFLLEIIWTAGD